MLNVEIRLPGTGQHYDFALDETAAVAVGPGWGGPGGLP